MLKENSVAKILQIIGWVELLATFVVAVFVDTEEIFGIDLGPVIWISAFITCMIFQGFAEIVELLYKNGKKQDMIIKLLKERSGKENNAPKTVLQDIEDHLPEM